MLTRKRLTVYEGNIPTLVYGTKQEYDRVLSLMIHYKIRPDFDVYEGRAHISDMNMLQYMMQLKQIDSLVGDKSPLAMKYLLHLSHDVVLRIGQVYGNRLGLTRAERMRYIARMNRDQVIKLYSQLTRSH